MRMFVMSSLMAAAVLAAATLHATAAAPAGGAEPTTVLDVMMMMTVPASNAIFEIADPPKTDEAWRAIRAQAARLADSGELLLAPSRARDKGEWVTQVRSYVGVATAAVKAADAKNFDALVAASDALADTCVECHKRYLLAK
jgi:hypothetical protein